MGALTDFRTFKILMYMVLIYCESKNYGISQIKNYNLPSLKKAASILQTTNYGLNYTFLINSLFNKSRLMEDTNIVSNINIAKNRENNELKQLKTIKRNDEKKNPSDSKSFCFSLKPYKNIFQSNSNNLKTLDMLNNTFSNITKQIVAYQKNEYLIGFSGTLFGRRIPAIEILKVTQFSENESMGNILSNLRQKRSVVHLYNMVMCATGCNPFAYKGYGCYCGFLGSGYAVDGIDSCCKIHDRCYIKAGCPMFLEYFIPYLWKCYYHQPLCAIDHPPYEAPKSCAQRLCECDRQLSLCLKRYPCPTSKAFCTSSPWRLLQNIIML